MTSSIVFLLNLRRPLGKDGGTLVCHLLQDLKVSGSNSVEAYTLCSFSKQSQFFSRKSYHNVCMPIIMYLINHRILSDLHVLNVSRSLTNTAHSSSSTFRHIYLKCRSTEWVMTVQNKRRATLCLLNRTFTWNKSVRAH